MKKLIVILTFAITACNSQVNTEQQDKETENGKKNAPAAVQLNNGSKWKADQTTKKNVAAMVELVNDSSYAYAINSGDLLSNLQSKIDTLVKQCRMQGEEHDALHVWLEKVLKDMKELKEEDDKHNETYASLKKDIERFYSSFE